MNTKLRWLFPIAASILAIAMTAFLGACGEDEPTDTTPAKLESSEPADGATVAEGSTVKLNFDKDPGDVTVNGNPTKESSGKTRTFKVTQAKNEIRWDNGEATGEATLNFTLTEPDTTPPSLTESTPKDGAKNVDPAPINDPAGGIVLTFSEIISKQELTFSRDDTELGAFYSIGDGDAADTVTVKPQDPLVNEATYKVSGSVEDASGNKGDVSISFTTKAKD